MVIVPLVNPKKTLPKIKPVEHKIVPVMDPKKMLSKSKNVQPKIVCMVDPKKTMLKLEPHSGNQPYTN